MKKSILCIAIAISVSILSSCSTEPKAGFSYDNENVEALTSVQFTNTSTDADSYEWNFGDDTETVKDANPKHTFTHSGNYTVMLTASSKDGSSTYSEQVEVLRPVQLYPGEKIAGIEIGEKWSSVKNKFGEHYDLVSKYYSDYDIFVNYVYDENDTYCVVFYCNKATIANDDVVLYGKVFNNFDGSTAQRIGLGDKVADLKSIYGTPEEYDTRFSDLKSYDYTSLGVTFGYNSTSADISVIMIYESNKKSASINLPGNISRNEFLKQIKE